MLNDKNSSMESMQSDPMIGANVELQMSKEEFGKFMKIPIEMMRLRKQTHLTQISLNRHKSYLNHPA